MMKCLNVKISCALSPLQNHRGRVTRIEALPCMNHYCKAGPSLMIAETRTLERCNGIESCHWNSTLCGSLPTSRATIWTIGTGTYHQVQDRRGKTFSRSHADHGWTIPWRSHHGQCALLFIFWCLQQGGGLKIILFFIRAKIILRSKIDPSFEWHNLRMG